MCIRILPSLLLLLALPSQANQALYSGAPVKLNPAAGLATQLNLGGYMELSPISQLDRKLEELAQDLNTLSILERNNQEYARLSEENQQNVKKLERHSNQCQVELLDGRDILSLASCYQGVANSVNTGLLSELEEKGQLRVGYNLQLATATPARFSLGVGIQNQTKGQVIAAPVEVNAFLETRRVTASGQTPSANLTVELDRLGTTYAVLDRLSARYQNEPDELFAEYEDRNLYPDDTSQNEKFVRIVEFELQDKAGYSEEELQEFEDLIQALEADPNLEVIGEADFVTATSIEARRARLTTLSFNYAQQLWPQGYAGITFNYYQAHMHRALLSLSGLEDDRNRTSAGATAERRARNHFDQGYQSKQALGMDIGLLWKTPQMQLGATLYNLNEPRFSYPNLNEQFQDSLLSPGGNLRDKDQNAFQELQEEGRLSNSKTARLTRHLVLDASYLSDSERWQLEGYLTLGVATNLVGDDYQHLGFKHRINHPINYLQQARWGVSHNLIGTQITSIHLGASFTPWLHLDLAFTPERSDLLERDYPRYLSLNFTAGKSL